MISAITSYNDAALLLLGAIGITAATIILIGASVGILALIVWWTILGLKEMHEDYKYKREMRRRR